jgi:hypothetical protein
VWTAIDKCRLLDPRWALECPRGQLINSSDEDDAWRGQLLRLQVPNALHFNVALQQLTPHAQTTAEWKSVADLAVALLLVDEDLGNLAPDAVDYGLDADDWSMLQDPFLDVSDLTPGGEQCLLFAKQSTCQPTLTFPEPRLLLPAPAGMCYVLLVSAACEPHAVQDWVAMLFARPAGKREGTGHYK